MEQHSSSVERPFAMAPHNSEPSMSPPLSKLKRFRFSQTFDFFLLRAIREADAHIPKWGHTDELFNRVLSTFLKLVPEKVFWYMNKLSKKTLIDHFKRLVPARKDQNQHNEKASGIIKEYGEKETLLDDLISEIDEKAEAARIKKEELTAHEQSLIEAGEMIRETALKRKSSATRKTEETDTASQPGSKRSCRHEATKSDDAITALILEQSKEQKMREEEKVKIEQRRLEIEQDRVQKEIAGYETLQLQSERRISLEEKRFELEKVEREQAIQERKHLLNIMAAFSKKLQ